MKAKAMNNSATTTMHRLIPPPGTDWPNVRTPVINPPGWEPERDLDIYRAAGLWPGSAPIPEEIGRNLARAIATEVLRDARLELAVAMAARMAFNRIQPADPSRREASWVRSWGG